MLFFIDVLHEMKIRTFLGNQSWASVFLMGDEMH